MNGTNGKLTIPIGNVIGLIHLLPLEIVKLGSGEINLSTNIQAGMKF